MLGLAIGTRAAIPHDGLFAPDAALAIDFTNGTAHRAGVNATFASQFTTTRTTTGWAADTSGVVQSFAMNTARLTDRGLELGEAATRSHGAFPANGANSGATSVALAAQGLFSPYQITGQGNANDGRQTGNITVTSGAPVHWRVRLQAGTSGSVQLRFVLPTPATASTVAGSVSAPTVGAVSAGAVSLIGTNTFADGSVEHWGTWTPNATGTARLLVGPNSATIGETVDIWAAQLTDAVADWMIGGATSVTQAADVATINLTGLSFTAGFLLRLDIDLLTTGPTVEYTRLYQADGGTDANKLATFLYRPTANLQIEQQNAGVNQGYVTLGGIAQGPISVTVGHGPNYIGGALNGTLVTPDLSATYSPPTRLHVGCIEDSSHLPIRLKRLAIYTQAPSDTRIAEVAF